MARVRARATAAEFGGLHIVRKKSKVKPTRDPANPSKSELRLAQLAKAERLSLDGLSSREVAREMEVVHATAKSYLAALRKAGRIPPYVR